MSKIIIHNDSGLPEYIVLDLVQQVVAGGKISGEAPYEQYCYGTRFTVGEGRVEDKYMVSCKLNRRSGTNTFYIYKSTQQA